MQPSAVVHPDTFPSLHPDSDVSQSTMLQPGPGPYGFHTATFPTQDPGCTVWGTEMPLPFAARDHLSATIPIQVPGPATHPDIIMQAPPSSDPFPVQALDLAADPDTVLQPVIGACDFHISTLPVQCPGTVVDSVADPVADWNTTMQPSVGSYHHDPTATDIQYHISAPDADKYWANRPTRSKRRYYPQGSRRCRCVKVGCDQQQMCSHCIKHTAPKGGMPRTKMSSHV